ncbi:MAG: hypothetical protein ACRCTQ_00840 [Brevinemataceae bacterium]
MSDVRPIKTIIHNLNNFTASLAEGIRRSSATGIVLCTDTESKKSQYNDSIEFDLLPRHRAEIYSDVDFLIIDQESEKTAEFLKSIVSVLSPETLIIDFSLMKGDSYNTNSKLLKNYCHYISNYVFLDHYPDDLTIRGTIFKGKIVAVVSNETTEVLVKAQEFWNYFGAKIVPTSADFFDEIVAETDQTIKLMAAVYANILCRDSWSDTLFFGFYNRNLREFLKLSQNIDDVFIKNVFINKENIRRVLSFIRRELDAFDLFLSDDYDVLDQEKCLKKYIDVSKDFQKKL